MTDATGEMTYDEAVSTLGRALKFGINPSLEPIKAMCAALGNPQESYLCVQVAGSNGKSSTTRMVAALLRAHGLKTGTYTSPHLVRYPERMEVDGIPAAPELFARSIAAALGAAEAAGVQATEFELLTCAALWAFAQEGVQAAVLECGLGGRWDATAVVTPQVAVITGIALEHTAILGDTLEAIAGEKAAIIKPGSTAVLADGIATREVFETRAADVGADVVDANPAAIEPYKQALEHLPRYQRANAATALTAAEHALGYPLDEAKTREALATVVVPGRFEVLRDEPLLMIDAAHNPQSAQVLASELSQRFVCATAPASIAAGMTAAGRPKVPTLLLGVLADKDVRGVVRTLVPLFDDVVVTASRSTRAISAKKLAAIVADEAGVEPRVTENVPEALGLLADTPTIATGSITIAGEVKGCFQRQGM